LAAGRYAEAITLFEESLKLAEVASDSLFTAFAMFNLGRANGLACNYAEGVIWFEKSIVLRKALPDQEGGWLSQNYLELGRLLASKEDWPSTIANFELGLAAQDQSDMLASDPLGYANVLEELETAYRAAGINDQANQLGSRIA